MAVTTARQVVAQPLSWLWQDRIPLGKLLILDGDPDLGKSLLALDFCARLSTGRPFPDGQPVADPANALVLSAEDNPADTIVPRLARLGANLERVFVWERHREEEDWPWRFPAQADRLDDALRRSDARLAVIDPIMAFLDDSVIAASDQSVRRALAPLMELAEKHRCAMLMHRHLNKQGSTRAVYRGLGSIGFMAACRFAMLVGRDPLAPERCILAQVRSSLARPQPSLIYQLKAADGELPTVDWLGTSPISADEVLACARPRGHGPRDLAAMFLEQFLAAGPRTSRDIWEAAQKLTLSPPTLNRAKKQLGIRCCRRYTDGRPTSYWLLRDQELAGDPTADPALRRLFGEMEKKHSPRTPLDEDDFNGDES